MLAFLDNLLLQPLMLVYAGIFDLLPEVLGIGPRLILFSLLLNLALLPAYQQMEQASRRTRQMRERVARDVARMRAHFRGRERYFYIRAVHRQHHYRPISALLGSADLWIQILVFATVYRFLSGFQAMQGESFLGIENLGAPDALLWGFNLLPLLMTAINIASAYAYVEDSSKRLQAVALAAIFLVLLYASPAGLVLYWTLNNLFSLLRNLISHHEIVRIPASISRFMRQLGALR